MSAVDAETSELMTTDKRPKKGSKLSTLEFAGYYENFFGTGRVSVQTTPGVSSSNVESALPLGNRDPTYNHVLSKKVNISEADEAPRRKHPKRSSKPTEAAILDKQQKHINFDEL